MDEITKAEYEKFVKDSRFYRVMDKMAIPAVILGAFVVIHVVYKMIVM